MTTARPTLEASFVPGTTREPHLQQLGRERPDAIEAGETSAKANSVFRLPQMQTTEQNAPAVAQPASQTPTIPQRNIFLNQPLSSSPIESLSSSAVEMGATSAKTDSIFRLPQVQTTEQNAPVVAHTPPQTPGILKRSIPFNQPPSSPPIRSLSSEDGAKLPSGEEIARNFLILGRKYYEDREYARAVGILRQGLSNTDLLPENRACDDTNALLCICLGNALSANDHVEEAIEVFERGSSFSKASSLTTAWLNAGFGTAHFKQGDFIKVCTFFRYALECPEITAENRMLWNLFLGRAFFELGHLDNALMVFHRVYQLQGATPETQARLLNHYGMTLLKVGRQDDAKMHFSSVLKIDGASSESIAAANMYLEDINKCEVYELPQQKASLSGALTAIKSSAEVLSSLNKG